MVVVSAEPGPGADPPTRRERFAWRNRLRENPRWRQPYRLGVGLVGVLLLIAAVITGPLPGPGGIPLFLLGLAVLASEFRRAHRIHLAAYRYVEIYRAWPLSARRWFWAGVVMFVLGIWWIGMIVVGVPGWVPEWLHRILRWLPGVR